MIPEQFDQYVRYRPGCFYYVRASGRDPQSVQHMPMCGAYRADVHRLEHFLCAALCRGAKPHGARQVVEQVAPLLGCLIRKKMIRIKRDYRWQVIQKIRKNIRQRIS